MKATDFWKSVAEVGSFLQKILFLSTHNKIPILSELS